MKSRVAGHWDSDLIRAAPGHYYRIVESGGPNPNPNSSAYRLAAASVRPGARDPGARGRAYNLACDRIIRILCPSRMPTFSFLELHVIPICNQALH